MLKIVKPSTEAERTTHTTLDTIEINPNIVRSWKVPPFQRALRVNAKVLEVAEEIKANDGVLPGIITLGVLGSDRFLIDGQHRVHAFQLSELLIGYCDVRILHVKDMAAMATEFYKLNSRVVNMRPDDYLRALETTNDQLSRLHKRCPFVGFDMVRRSDRSPILSMSAVLRCWSASSKEVPQPHHTGGVVALAGQLIEDECTQLISFLGVAYAAWGRDAEFHRLWGGLNMTLCMWLYRRMVITQYSPRTPKLDSATFQKCLMSLSADGTYLDWLVGRQCTDRDRSPGLARIKSIFSRRLIDETGKKPNLPQPAWGGK